ncbi:MAG: hypothetical protein VB099_21085 [Candidatus Limiplasma sp.]|nr:hypothetical protein [Candidatus Limiplasma sp.]
MADIIKALAVILLLVLVIFSIMLGDAQHNTWLAIGGCISAIIFVAPLYLLGYVLGLLQAIQANTFKTAEANAACSEILAHVLEKMKATSDVQPAALPTSVAEPLSATQVFDKALGVAQIDRSQEIIACPACGTNQKSNRNVCFRCGIKFVGANEGVEHS